MLLTNTKRKTADREASEAAAIADQQFRDLRAQAVEAAVVCVNGNNYNANERSIQRMTSALLAYGQAPDDAPALWSLADTPPGVMTPITVGELRTALRDAVAECSRLWARTE